MILPCSVVWVIHGSKVKKIVLLYFESGTSLSEVIEEFYHLFLLRMVWENVFPDVFHPAV